MPHDAWIANLWNRLVERRERKAVRRDLRLGSRSDARRDESSALVLPHPLRTQHLAIFGRTGSGKSTLLKHMARQDIDAGRGFIFFDLHGDATPELLTYIAERERTESTDFSLRTVVVAPGDPERAVGLDLLGSESELRRSVEVLGVVDILKERWNLEALGPRTEELLRNALLLLSESNLTIVDLPLVLTSERARRALLAESQNEAVKLYFRSRYNSKSEALQSQYRDAVLNKVTAFTDDPHFRHALGQVHPAFSLPKALEEGCWVFVNLPKGELGSEVETFGSLILSRVRDAVFGRQSRALFTIYADEFHALARLGGGVNDLFSESRKFAVSVVAATQFLDQLEDVTRASLLSLGSLIFFALSPPDAIEASRLLGGGTPLAFEFGTMDVGAMVLARGGEIRGRAQVPMVEASRADHTDLLARSNDLWSKSRADVELEIVRRAEALAAPRKEALEGWM